MKNNLAHIHPKICSQKHQKQCNLNKIQKNQNNLGKGCLRGNTQGKTKIVSKKYINIKEGKRGIISLLSQKRIIQKESKSKYISKSKNFDITESEKKIYGNRCPSGFTKLKLLGRGGCAIVWL